MKDEHHAVTRYGFEFGAIKVERIASHRGRVFLGIGSRDAGDGRYTIEVYASPSGKSIRVFTSKDKREWTPIPKPQRCGCGAYTHDVAMCDDCGKIPDECFCDQPVL